jgi:hypothetical protein
VDRDGDGVPDDWENFYFGSLVHGAAEDADGDGAGNLSEYRAGTDPDAAASLFALRSVRRTGQVNELRFTFAPNKPCFIQASDDLDAWETVTGPRLTFTSAWLDKSDVDATYPAPVVAVWSETRSGGQPRYYRVIAP